MAWILHSDASNLPSKFFFPVDFRGHGRLRLPRRPVEKWLLTTPRDRGRRTITERQRPWPSVRFLAEQLPQRLRASERLLPTLQPDAAIAHAMAWQTTSSSQRRWRLLQPRPASRGTMTPAATSLNTAASCPEVATGHSATAPRLLGRGARHASLWCAGDGDGARDPPVGAPSGTPRGQPAGLQSD
ncbi:hypothetical protein ACQ4PT_004303 [Festuca glaucescens]